MNEYPVNADIAKLKRSASVDLMQMAKDLEKERGRVLNLAAGEPDFSTPEAISEAAISALREGHTHYLVGQGYEPLRERICQEYADFSKLHFDIKQIIVTPGAKYALYLTMRTLLTAGDAVLIPTPSWLSYFPIVESCGAQGIEISLDENEAYEITEELLEASMHDAVKVLLLNYPNNPTSKVMTRSSRDAVFRFMDKHPQVILVYDEIYDRITFSDPTDRVLLSERSDLQNRIIYINGFSKTFAMTGWRLGYLAGPLWFTQIAYKLFTHSLTATPSFIQEAAVSAFDQWEEVEKMRQIYLKRSKLLVSGLREIPSFSVIDPEGTFYVWAKFNYQDMKSDDFAKFLLDKASILTVPGHAYGSGADYHLRLSFACPEAAILEAIEKLKQIL